MGKSTLPSFAQIMCSDAKYPPPFAMQSDYIYLWANANIYYAMNYILSPLCSGFDEFAIITLLKQLTVFSSPSEVTFVQVIKEIWNEIFTHENLKGSVLNFCDQNIASYSLKTLAVDHMDGDPEILATLIRLLKESI